MQELSWQVVQRLLFHQTLQILLSGVFWVIFQYPLPDSEIMSSINI